MNDEIIPQQPVGRNELLKHDGPLREDVRRLGTIVGELLTEQLGEGFFHRLEEVRETAIKRREEGAGVDALSARIDGLPVETAEALTRAFSTYFQVVNVAERVHRIRRRRDYQRQSSSPQPDSLVHAFTRLKQQGVTAKELLYCLSHMDIEPVFTAHPTEAVRRSLLDKETDVVRSLTNDFDGTRTPIERVHDLDRLRMALTAGWQTSETSPVKPSVQDEYEHVGWYLAGPIYGIVPVFYEALEEALQAVYGLEADLPQLLRFGSWVGGDMDGNPNVGADTITSTLRGQREQILGRYIAEVGELANLLSQTTNRVDVSHEVRRRIEGYRRQLPETAALIRPRHADMPYRVFLTLVRGRLQATLRDSRDGYPDAAAFVADIQLVADSLVANKGLHAGWFAVRRLLVRARCFGFHLARLDVRQDSRIHSEAVAERLEDASWPERAPEEQAALLADFASGDKTLPESEGASSKRMQAVYAALLKAQHNYGPDATGIYIISMARHAADVLAVIALARQAGMVDGAGKVPLDIAPLFETVDDLKRAPHTLTALLDDPVYREHLSARGNRQVVMLGYSDSGKDGGTIASRWGLQRGQVELLEVAAKYGIRLSFFHGRGGSVSRGGGLIGPALMSSPRGSVGGTFRVTEQGEVIHRKYGIRALALRTLEQTTSAVLHASLRPRRPDSREAAWKDAMALLSLWSREHYRGFVDKPGFVDYFRTATPIDVIERMTLGSRPSRRGTMKGVESLRAIPWVFAWTQCRAIITGWYGFGTAMDRFAAEQGEDKLVEMAQNWAFFSTMLGDLEMVLVKCDLGIAEAFSRLSGDLHDAFFPMIQEEFQRSLRWVLKLQQAEELLRNDPRLAQSIRLRNPYVDPMSLVQVDLLRRWRAGGSEDDELLHALVATVNGVSQGLQNTG